MQTPDELAVAREQRLGEQLLEQERAAALQVTLPLGEVAAALLTAHAVRCVQEALGDGPRLAFLSVPWALAWYQGLVSEPTICREALPRVFPRDRLNATKLVWRGGCPGVEASLMIWHKDGEVTFDVAHGEVFEAAHGLAASMAEMPAAFWGVVADVVRSQVLR